MPISTPTISIVLCDSQPVTIAGVRSLLESSPGLEFAGAASSLDELDAVPGVTQAIVLLDKDLGLPAISEWIKRVCSIFGNPGVVVWGTVVTELEALRLLQSGARGVLRKTVSGTQLSECLRAVAAGESWIERGVIRSVRRRAGDSRDFLTVREREVLQLVDRGLRNREIADELGIRPGTVKIHLKHIFEKTGVRGRLGLALSALQRAAGPAVAENKGFGAG